MKNSIIYRCELCWCCSTEQQLVENSAPKCRSFVRLLTAVLPFEQTFWHPGYVTVTSEAQRANITICSALLTANTEKCQAKLKIELQAKF